MKRYVVWEDAVPWGIVASDGPLGCSCPEVSLGVTLLRGRGSLCSLVGGVKVGLAHTGGSIWPVSNSSQRPYP